jgi:hypothetical protein
MRRLVGCSLLAVLVGGAGVVPAASLVQAGDLPAPRPLNVRLSAAGVHAPDSLAAGRYRIEIRQPSRTLGSVTLVKPDRGYSRADFRADNRRQGPASNRRIRQNLRFFGGVELGRGGTGVLWETLYAGRYWLLGVTERGLAIKTVRVHGFPSASTFPRVTAEATSFDQSLQLTRHIPRAGRILIRNNSHRLDALLLLPLKEGVSYVEFLRWLRHPDRRPPFAPRGLKVTAPLSARAGYVLRYRLRPGRYVAMGLRGANLLFNSGGNRVRRWVRPVVVGGRAPAPSMSRARLSTGTVGFASASPRNLKSEWPGFPLGDMTRG